MAENFARPVPKPSGNVISDTRIRRVTVDRYRETQAGLNQPAQDTIPGTGSGDQ